MSFASRVAASNNHSRRVGSVQSVHDGVKRNRAGSRAGQSVVSRDDAYSYALRVALLHYLLQPRKKRKEYVNAPKPVSRVHTSSVGDLMKELVPSGSSSIKLPHNFRHALEKRMSLVLQGVEKMPGYNDPPVKRTFAEAYTAFTAKDFAKSIDKDRKVEPLVLIFYSSATKAQGRGKAPDDHAWKVLVDRHLAMFIRLLSSILKDLGGERDRPELVSRLNTLEKKLLTNDQNLFLDTGQADHSFVEVDIPLTYEVKDMQMVQAVAKIFGISHSQVQTDLDTNISAWTEDAALKDFKTYQFRLAANMPGTLQRQDFDVDDAFEEWKRHEGPHLARIFAEILSVRPDLRKASTSGNDKSLPVRPNSMYGEDQSYADLGKMLSNTDPNALGFDQSVSLGSLSLDDTSTIRSVDEPSYTFIPTDPRAVYKAILQYATAYDQSQPETDSPLSEESTDLLIELSGRWRIPQFSRYVTFVEVATRRFIDQEMAPEQLYECLDLVKQPLPEPKKPSMIQMYTSSLPDISSSRWTMVDFAAYQQALRELHEALLRDLYTTLMRCYETKPPSVGVTMALLSDHIYNDPAFSQRPEDAVEYSRHLENGLRKQAAQAYRDQLDSKIPRNQLEWNFGHVVTLGKAVVSLVERTKKRYKKNPEVMGVSPFKILVESTFPSFEEDAQEFIKRVLETASERNEEVALEDGFDLYKELVEIRKIHVDSLPGKPFAFSIESLLEGFIWRWIRNTEEKTPEVVEGAVKHDQFTLQTHNPDGIPNDDERHSSSIVDTFALFNVTVDQILQFEWGDEVHHAKFMTAVSKGFAAGIGRYCELVEQQFAREMERQTSQEVLATSKTTQEKFFQYAKDAWNTKERIEPFQFLPESFVKFNNIEWAMQALDKLEKKINVDRCAEVLRTAGGPKPVVKKPAHYVFTIKIVEAEDLKACDPSGTSDPYVVLCDEYQKRLAKTRIVMRNLNPRWDESIDITVSGALNIIATIWDYDTFGDHDFVGRTSLKLDPVHFSDYLPREFWLDLDTQGRLLLRVSMEGERDDIQFHFGKAFRHLKRTERDMVRKITEKLTPHINASLSPEALRSLLSRGLAASMASLWKKRQSNAPLVTAADVENALRPLFNYFNDNFAIMKQTLTDATMVAVMTRLWKEVLMAIENLVVPPLSDKPSTQKSLTQSEMDVVYRWLEMLFAFFNARDVTGEVLGVPADVLKSPKWHELASLNFFYFDSTENLIRTSERMAAANVQRAQQQQLTERSGLGASLVNNRLSAPPTFGATFSGAGAFGSLGTIRRGKSIMMSRNLGTMRRAKEEKRKEAQADPSDDMILRILRMRPEAAAYLRDRQRQKERMAATQAAAMIVRQSVTQGFNAGPAFGGALYGRNNLPRR
ncbi:hypothetical protein B0T26DRAFT_686852 [Lasiosphaeria miniovina]|uniref:C2 domain-containing protein n=1 Tax=Lasiosphaeria miniovina TaxID=1954250 RepID=A0AA40BGZ6_9PEZI|nr:uncharacterized protein B0T26DRAFT_686852 [Lasiosphaeria miniovina]KAK0734038.1 hypothetical protein B0T26DRAFT_686852 [Lasiosphaeria miniovina]